MAKIKSYSDLQQSRKLAEILPLESADMVLLHEEPYETSGSKFDGLHQALCISFSKYDKSWRQKYKNISYFPCWSLASLLGVLPKIDNYRPEIRQENNCFCCAYTQRDSNGDLCWYYADNPIDACYEMIIRLHEQKIL